MELGARPQKEAFPDVLYSTKRVSLTKAFPTQDLCCAVMMEGFNYQGTIAFSSDRAAQNSPS